MHRQDGARARGDCRLHLIQVDVARVQANIYEYGPRTGPDNHVGRCNEAHRRCDDLVARPDAGCKQSHLHARGGRSLGPDGTAAQISRQRRFELGDFRTARQPARSQNLRDALDGLLVEGRARERQHLLHKNSPQPQWLMSGPPAPHPPR